MIRLARAAMSAWGRARWALWVIELRLRMRVAGARLEIEAPHGATIETRPRVLAFPRGDGAAVLRLKIGRGVHFGRHVTFELDALGENSIAIGDQTYVMDGVRFSVRDATLQIGSRVNLREWVRLQVSGRLEIGDDCAIGQHCTLHCAESLVLEDMVGVAERSSVIDCDHLTDGSDVYFRSHPLTIEPVRLGRNTFVAANSIVTRGTRTGRNCFVGAGSLVLGREYPEASLVAGNPARVIRDLREDADPESGAGPSAAGAVRRES